MFRYEDLSQFERGALHMSLSAVCIAFFGFFAKLSMHYSIPLPFVVFLRFFVPLLLILPYCYYKGTFKCLTISKGFWIQILRALFVIISQYALFYYLTRAPLLNAIMLWNTGPILMPIIGKVFFNHQIGKTTWMTCILGLIGVVCVMQPNIDILNFFSIWGLLSGFAVAFSQVLYGLSTEEERNDVNLFYLLFFTSLLSFIPLTISYWTAELPFTFFKLPFLQMGALALLFILMGITTIGNQFLRGVAYQYAKPSSLAPFIYLSIVISGFIDWIYYHEILNFTAYIGVILVIYATVMRLIYTQRV